MLCADSRARKAGTGCRSGSHCEVGSQNQGVAGPGASTGTRNTRFRKANGCKRRPIRQTNRPDECTPLLPSLIPSACKSCHVIEWLAMASIEQQCLPNRIHECESTEFLERFGTSFVPFEDACGLPALTDPSPPLHDISVYCTKYTYLLYVHCKPEFVYSARVAMPILCV